MDIRTHIASLGWSAASNKFWETLSACDAKVAFLAPPLDTIPSPAGNAIYCLVERLVERLGPATIALARAPVGEAAEENPIAERLIYFHRSVRPTLMSRLLPYRLKKRIFGTGAPELLDYGRRAGAVLRALQAKGVVVEDVPMLVPSVASCAGPAVRVALHQHINAPTGLPPVHWRKVCKSLKGIAFVAKKTHEETLRRHGDLGVPTRVIYNGVNLSHYSPFRLGMAGLALREQLGIAADASVLLFVGRLLPHKGVAESAEAFNLAGVRDSRMLIVGDPDIQLFRNETYMQRLKVAVESSGGRIILVGKVSQAELPKWYASSDALIVPSIGAEGLPKIITEALAMGKPVLASDCGGSWELLREGENGWLIRNPSDVESMANLVKRVLGHRPTLVSLSARIMERDRPLVSEERMVEEFVCALKEWVDEGDPRK